MTPMDREHRERLRDVHPELVEKVDRILSAMLILDRPMFVVEGVRSEARQAALFAKGRTEPGPKVTNVDGVTHRSRHQIDPATGFGMAVDLAFQGDHAWDIGHPWRLYGEAGKAVGLHWGGDWKGLVDCPHLEMP